MTYEQKFFLLCQTVRGLPVPKAEFRFHSVRRWRFDFAWEAQKVSVEIEGGVWMKGGGGHQRGRGFEEDCEKYLEATLMGWTVIRLCPKQIIAPTIERIAEFVKGIK